MFQYITYLIQHKYNTRILILAKLTETENFLKPVCLNPTFIPSDPNTNNAAPIL